MGYNISRVMILYNVDARIRFSDLVALTRDPKKLPEDDFLTDPLLESTLNRDIGTEEYLQIGDFSWQGEGSGRTYEFLVKEVCPKIMGKLQVAVIWEGGESIDGLMIHDGRVTECDVKMNLIPKLTLE